MGLAMSIHRICRDAIASHGGGSLDWVRVAVGELSAVEPELLEFAWQAVIADGPDAHARLEVEWHPARQLCAQCGEPKQRVAGSWLRLCPDCGLPLRVEGGDELDVLQVSFSAPDEED